MTTSAGTVITSPIFLQKIFYRIKLIDQWQGLQDRGAKGGSLSQAPIVRGSTNVFQAAPN